METLSSPPSKGEAPLVEITANASPTALPTTPLQTLASELQNDQKRRSSSRSIKRKRFDDEIVEYSVNFQQSRGEQNRIGRPRTISQTYVAPAPPPLVPQTPPATSAPATPAAVQPVVVVPPEVVVAVPPTPEKPAPPPPVVAVAPVTPLSAPAVVAPPAHTLAMPHTPLGLQHMAERRRPPRSVNKRARKGGRPPNVSATKDLGRWKPIDDLALIIGIQQTNDLRMVHRGIKFSCKFTMPELQSRWFTLLYEPAISRTAVAAMRNLHPELIESVQRKALYSVPEEELLGTFKSTENPKLEQFQELLDKNASVFFCSRSAKALQNQWQLMKQYQLLPDQVVKPLQAGDTSISFSDAEELILDAELNEQRDEALEMELSLVDRRGKREIRLLENELSRWNVLVDSITGVGIAPEFDGQTLAVLRGRLVRYLMRSKEITFGRDAKDCVVDVDLSLEGPAARISRRQGTIKLRSNGDFFIANEGKRPIFIDGVPLIVGNKARLGNNCVLEICGLRFVFLVNYELINAIRHESAKTTAPLN